MTKYVFMAGSMFVKNARNGACHSYYPYNFRFDNLIGSLLYRLPGKILDALNYYGIYKFALRRGTDPLSTASEFLRCGEIYWEKTTVRDGFMSYDFRRDKIIGLEAETVQTDHGMRSGDVATTSDTLPAVLVYFRAGVLQVMLEIVRREYSKYRGFADKPDKVWEQGDAEVVYMDFFL